MGGISVVNANVLDVPASALLLTIDGSRRGMEGNVARQFAARHAQDWGDMLRVLKFPTPLGRCVAVPWDGDAPSRLYLFAATLHHVGVLDEADKTAAVTRAFHEAMRLCTRHGARSLATPILRGGWRLARDDALRIMPGPAAQSAAQAASGLRVSVCCRDPAVETVPAPTR